MKKKNKNKYIPFKKTIIPVVSILMVIVAALIVVYTLDLKKFNKGREIYDNEYMIHVMYLIMDKDAVPSDITMDKTFSYDPKVGIQGMLGTSNSMVPLTKKGDYLYVDLDKFTNPSLLKNETDYVFTNYNLNGEIIDGCEYDKKTNSIKVPASYFAENKFHPIQLEIQTLLSKDDFYNMETVVNVKKFLTKKVVFKNSSIAKDPTFKISGFGSKKLTKDNVHIYMNNMKTELDDNMYNIYDDNEIVLLFPPAQINKLDIKIDFSLTSVFAREYVSDPNDFVAIKVDGPLNIPNSGNFSLTGPEYGSNTTYKQVKYCGNFSNDGCLSDGSWSPSSASWSYTYADYPSSYYRFDTSSWDVMYNFSVGLDSLIINTSKVADSNAHVESVSGYPDRIAFYCLNHNYSYSSNSGAEEMDFHYDVIARTPNSISIHYYSTNYYHSQDAQAYLRFEWDNVAGGLKVRKTDEFGTPIKGLNIYAIPASGGTAVGPVATDADGYAVFSTLDVGTKYKFYEDCSSTIEYNGHTGTTLETEGINCTYPSTNPYGGSDGNGFTPVSDYDTNNAAIVTFDNIKYRYCAVANKTKGAWTRAESNVTMQLTLPANVCKNYPSGTTINKTTDSNGNVVFTGIGYCDTRNGTARIGVTDQLHSVSVIGENPRNITLVRSQIKVTKDGGITYRGKTYAKDSIVVMSESDFNTYSANGQVTEVCPETSKISINDEDYMLLWKKVNNSIKTNNNATIMPNISFTVKNKTTNAGIRALSSKVSYTDANNTTKTCYVYTTDTGSGTTDQFTTDSNGEVCIVNLPKEEVYTVTEVSSNVYNNEAIDVTAKNRFEFNNTTTYNNYEYVIDWTKKEYKNNKTSNSDGNLANAEFNVKDANNNLVKTKPTKETVFDKNGVSKSCYVIDLVTASNNTNTVFKSDNSGYTCIIGLTNGVTYTIEETKPSTYYAYANNKTFTEQSKLLFNTNTTANVKQCPTEVKITKSTTELSNASNDYKKLVYEELQKLTFNVLDSNDNVLSFIYNSTTGHYEYVNAVNELTGSTQTGSTAVRLLNGVNVSTANISSLNLDMIINYLPVGTYKLREVSSVTCDSTSNNSSNGSNCTCENNSSNPGSSTTEEASCSNMGYGKISDITFTVTVNNNGDLSTCDKTDNSVKVSIINKPTVAKFTKKDFYGYYNDVDEVNFENDEEVEAFDNITFRVRKQSTINSSGVTSTDNNNYEWFYKTANGEYRLDVLHKCSTEGQVVGGYTCTKNLHTNGGDMKFTHLCKCETYVIEEYEVPDGTVFILPKANNNTCEAGYIIVNKNGKTECHPGKTIKVCDCDNDDPESSPPVIIEDLPTKQVFIKKDLKYNTIITDQRTTFELFLTNEDAANNGRTCNPYDSASKTRDCIQIYFSERTVLSDETDGSYSYRMLSNQSANNKVKELHVDPNTGKLILRYLPAYIDREYVLYETKAPKGYNNPSGEKSVTRFKVVNDTIDVHVSDVPNRPSKVIIGKYDRKTGELIPGVKFKVYKVNNYDENLTAMMQSKSNALEFKTIRDGSYEAREVYDTNLITTCTDREGSPCSSLGLVNDNYENTLDGQFENSITIKEGQALIQYLDSDSYYVIEEVEAPAGYKLPDRESDRWTLFYVPESEEVTKETKIYNTETFFTFYKFDEYNNLIDGAKFKLQKLNDDKIYEDLAVEDVSTEETKIYKVSTSSDNYEITTLNGEATIYRLTEGQYRVIEIEAPAGYELPNKTYNVVTFLVDKQGHTYGSNIIANKKKTKKIDVIPYAEAELVVNIQTGRVVVKYGLIITGILGLISLLIFIRKKVSK